VSVVVAALEAALSDTNLFFGVDFCNSEENKNSGYGDESTMEQDDTSMADESGEDEATETDDTAETE
jgi:hypothetical protein